MAKQQKAKVAPARKLAWQTLIKVADGMSLSSLQTQLVTSMDDARDRALSQELIYGVLRWQIKLDGLIKALLKKALKPKDQDIQWILRLALYELLECRSPDYAVINDAVSLTRSGKKKWASGLVNAILRNFLREKDSLLENLDTSIALYAHPQWMLEKVKADWPDCWQAILTANNQRPPLWLRVNERQTSLGDYQNELTNIGLDTKIHAHAKSALWLLDGIDVQTLPAFEAGAVSVQDAGAQLSAVLLKPEPGQQVLDLCAAPGGKTCHMLEQYPQIKKMVAVEVDASRMMRVEENLQRLQLNAKCLVADARKLAEHFPEPCFDRILVDAPCSASGVIRRHPDIKILRRESDIDELCELQFDILKSAWSALVAGGRLLYVTCSVFKQENVEQMERFMADNTDAEVVPLDVGWGVSCSVGRQLLPGADETDGFYFCLLQKK